jgi:hypothetical protein
VPGEFETITEQSILYPEKIKSELQGLPKNIKNAHEQALKSYNASLYESIEAPSTPFSAKYSPAENINQSMINNNTIFINGV